MGRWPGSEYPSEWEMVPLVTKLANILITLALAFGACGCFHREPPAIRKDLAAKEKPLSEQKQELWLHPKCRPAPATRPGPYVVLNDGALMIADGCGTRVSRDNGATWSEVSPIFEDGERHFGPAGVLPLKTRDGTIVIVYMNLPECLWEWDKEAECATANTQLDVWALRSLDGGKTWIDHQRILDGYCGGLINMIQTSTGEIVVPVQDVTPDRKRHAQYAFVSADEGQTWQRSNMLDVGGCGDHDGSFEATIEELTSGRLLMLLRTNLDYFWEAYSDDKGRSWREMRPSSIDASSSPGFLLRLKSGRLALTWNRLCLEGQTEVPDEDRWHEKTISRPAASWQRAELSVAFSEDDGKSWTDPVVIIRQPGAWVCYPYIHEASPGELWIGNRGGVEPPLCVILKESDFAMMLVRHDP